MHGACRPATGHAPRARRPAAPWRDVPQTNGETAVDPAARARVRRRRRGQGCAPHRRPHGQTTTGDAPGIEHGDTSVFPHLSPATDLRHAEPNATRQALEIAGATQEWRLFPVACTRLLGHAVGRDCTRGWPALPASSRPTTPPAMGGESAPSARPASGSRVWTGAPSWSRVRRWVSAPVVDAGTTGAAGGRGTDGLLRHWRWPCAMTVAWCTGAVCVPTVAWGTGGGLGHWRWLGPGIGLGTGMVRELDMRSGHRRWP
jgi:hypothetical protein